MTGARGLSAWAAMVLAVAAPASATPDVLTLDEAVALALRNNRSVGVAALQVQRAEKKLGVARSHRLPNLEFQGTAGTTLNPIRISFPAGAFGTFPTTGPIPSEDTVVEAPRTVTGNVNATLSQPLTQLHKIGLNTRLNELNRDTEQEKLREERTAIAAEVRSLYYGLLQTESVLRAKEEQVQVYRELDRVVGEQVTLEVALRSDGIEVKSRLATEEYELAGLRGDLATGKERMNYLLDRDLSQDFGVVEVPETSLEEVDLQLAIARAFERRPDLAQARLAVSYSSYINIDLLPRNIAQVGLQLKWEPFDWGRRGKERAEKTLQLEQAKNSARQAEDQVRLDVSQRFRKLQEARLLIEAERLGREAAQEKLRVVTSRHGQEAALLKDLLEAQAAKSAAVMQYDRALLTFWTAKADFQKAIGEEQ